MTDQDRQGPLHLVPGAEAPAGPVEGDDVGTCSTIRQAHPTSDPLVGTTVAARYRILARLGAGAMGAVYRAEQVMLRKTVALKLLAGGDDHDGRQRFLQEARIAATLKHPGIAEVYDFGVTDEGLAFYVMEYLDGTDLEHRLASRGPLPAGEAISIARGVAQALSAAHASGVVHRDLKPANIFLVPQKVGGEVVKVVDFGISKVLAEGPGGAGGRLTLPGFSCGTPCYMSPEQAGGQAVDTRSDIYSLGIVLYEMLCGRPPFDAPEVVRTLHMHLSDPPPPLTQQGAGLQIPPELEAVVMRALAKKREERFASMSELDAALAGVATRVGHPALTTAPGPEARRGDDGAEDADGALPPKRSRLPLWLALAGLALLIGVGAALMTRGGGHASAVVAALRDAAPAIPVAVPAASAPASTPAAPALAATPPPAPTVPARTPKPSPAHARPSRPAAVVPSHPVPAARAPLPPQKGYRLDDLKPYGRKAP